MKGADSLYKTSKYYKILKSIYYRNSTSCAPNIQLIFSLNKMFKNLAKAAKFVSTQVIRLQHIKI